MIEEVETMKYNDLCAVITYIDDNKQDTLLFLQVSIGLQVTSQ